jgi:uncharacterized protein
MKIYRAFIDVIFGFYKYLVKPLIGNGHCRFSPTCSEYAKECFKSFSFAMALWYSTVRILRCHPFNKGGYDPVPPSLLRQCDQGKCCKKN